MTPMVPVALARRRPPTALVVVAVAAAGTALVLSIATFLLAAARRAEVESSDPLSMAVGSMVLALSGLALVALGRRRLGTAWVVSAAVLSAGSLARLWVDLGFDARNFGAISAPRALVGAAGVFGRLCFAGGVGAAALAASLLLGRPAPRRSLVRAGTAFLAVLLAGVALDPGSVDPSLNDAFGAPNPLAPWFSLQPTASLLRLLGSFGLVAVAAVGLAPVARPLGRSPLLQLVVGVPFAFGGVALAFGMPWATVVALFVPPALVGAELVLPSAATAAHRGRIFRRTRGGPIDGLVAVGLEFGRLVALGWAVVLALAGSGGTPGVMGRTAVPWALLTLAAVVTVCQLVQPRSLNDSLSRALVAAEVAVGLAFAFLGPSSTERHSRPGALQPPGWPWPLVGIAAAGAVFGPAAGAGFGAVLGLVRLGVELRAAPTANDIEILTLVNTVGLYALAGGLSGLVVGRLRRAEAEVAAAHAREEVARALHDGVMQALAVIRRRADPEVAEIAAAADRELRTYLAQGPGPPEGLAEVLREAVNVTARTHGVEAALALDPELPELEAERLAAVRGIVGEALANAAKHSGATHITLFAGPDLGDDRIMVSVRDDGVGFDVERAAGDRGLARSIRGRAAEAGIPVEVHSEPGNGTEVCLWP